MNKPQRDLATQEMRAARECTFQISDAIIKNDMERVKKELTILKKHIASVEKKLTSGD